MEILKYLQNISTVNMNNASDAKNYMLFIIAWMSSYNILKKDEIEK